MTQIILPKQLTTDRLILKAIVEADIPAYEKYFIDYKVIRHLSSAIPWPYPADGVKTYFKEVLLPNQGHDKWNWGIFLKDNPDELIGAISLWRLGSPENRGFWLGHRFWGQGIMTEAVTPIIDLAFTELGFEKLVFSNAKGNIGSRRIKEKTGATLVDIRPASFIDPQYTEHELWELTKEAWFNHKGA